MLFLLKLDTKVNKWRRARSRTQSKVKRGRGREPAAATRSKPSKKSKTTNETARTTTARDLQDEVPGDTVDPCQQADSNDDAACISHSRCLLFNARQLLVSFADCRSAAPLTPRSSADNLDLRKQLPMGLPVRRLRRLLARLLRGLVTAARAEKNFK